MEAQIAALRAELLHKEQENERVQMQLAKEKEERERAERQACSQLLPLLHAILPPSSPQAAWMNDAMAGDQAGVAFRQPAPHFVHSCGQGFGERTQSVTQSSRGRLHLRAWYEVVGGGVQVTGLTRLLEGQKEAASAGGGGRKENRRETWCPGAKGKACQSLHVGTPQSFPNAQAENPVQGF